MSVLMLTAYVNRPLANIINHLHNTTCLKGTGDGRRCAASFCSEGPPSFSSRINVCWYEMRVMVAALGGGGDVERRLATVLKRDVKAWQRTEQRGYVQTSGGWIFSHATTRVKKFIKKKRKKITILYTFPA